MVRTCSIIVLLLASFTLSAQEEAQPVLRSGLLRAQGTIAFGTFTDLTDDPIYLHGNLEYYINPKLSVRGDSYFYLKPNTTSILNKNHQLFIGPAMHISTGGNFSPYAGIQGGIALSEYNHERFSNLSPNPKNSIAPLLSFTIGFNYYATNWFHLFMDGRQVFGTHYSDPRGDASLNEFRFSFGLGFNINTK